MKNADHLWDRLGRTNTVLAIIGFVIVAAQIFRPVRRAVSDAAGWLYPNGGSPMGKYNSSATRVGPLFRQLLERDPTGASWIENVLQSARLDGRLGAAAGQLGAAVLAAPGILVDDNGPQKPRFEYPAPPSDEFLRWLIGHPDQMRWPTKKGVELKYGDDTQRRRKRLLGREGSAEQESAQDEALRELDRFGPSGAARRWWAFEGFTKVDFCIETERLVVFVEGKRTEKLTTKNDWFRSRSQLVRNMEVVGAVAGNRACGVMLAVEHPLELEEHALEDSTPHLTSEQRAEVGGRYLGQACWKDICAACGVDFASLPDIVE